MVDIQSTNEQSSDDQELAKVLAGVSAQADSTPLSADEPIVTTPLPDPAPALEEEAAAPVNDEPAVTPAPAAPDFSSYAPTTPSMPSDSSDLETIKKDAIVALRPLVDKLTLAPEEKFDTYLLLLRSTDDKALIAPANEAAKAITDETRRAQALLDIIKEIDYLSGQPAA